MRRVHTDSIETDNVTPDDHQLSQGILDMASYHKETADRFITEKQALMNVLRQRIQWHQARLEQAQDATEQEAHLGMIQRDEVTLEDIQMEHAKRKAFYERQNVALADLK